MSPEQFTYWLQGFVELTDGELPTPNQWKSMCEHLKTVFHKVTPPVLKRDLPISELERLSRELPRGPMPGLPTITC